MGVLFGFVNPFGSNQDYIVAKICKSLIKRLDNCPVGARQMLGEQKLQVKRVRLMNEQIAAYKTQISGMEGKSSVNWMFVIIAIIIGIIWGVLISKH